jgi:hypothetical protein
MKRRLFIIGLALMAVAACKHAGSVPRETIGLVQSIVEDTTGIRKLVEQAGGKGADGSIALLGEPEDVAVLARRFAVTDRMDNIDGRQKPDSLPDFAGETFHALLDSYNAPYSQFVKGPQGLDSLREVAVNGALHAWDTVCFRSSTGHGIPLKKASAKILVFASSLQQEYGLFDVDTLQKLVGGKCHLLSPVDILVDDALAAGAQNILVWAPDAVRESKVWEKALESRHRTDATLAVVTPKSAKDVRTQLRDVLRQYLVTGLPLDALIIDSYRVNPAPLQSELGLIRLCGTEEDAAFDKMLSARFQFLEPTEALLDATFNLLREENLFAHKIAKPVVKYYENAESETGEVILVETSANHVKNTYVPSLD